MKIRMTKKRIAILENAISTDELLYEHFRRMHLELDKKRRRLYREGCVREVIQRQGKMLVKLRIEKVQVTQDGMLVIVV